jgi:hypothetical protein
MSIAYVLLILGTELEIKWNHLDGLGSVETTGQLIPLTVGCFSLFRSLMLNFFAEEEPEAEPPSAPIVTVTAPPRKIHSAATV